MPLTSFKTFIYYLFLILLYLHTSYYYIILVQLVDSENVRGKDYSVNLSFVKTITAVYEYIFYQIYSNNEK